MASGPEFRVEREIYPDNIEELISRGRALRNQMLCEAGKRLFQSLGAVFKHHTMLPEQHEETKELHST